MRWTGFMLAWIADLGGQEYAQALATIGIQPQHLAILTLLEAEGPLCTGTHWGAAESCETHHRDPAQRVRSVGVSRTSPSPYR